MKDGTTHLGNKSEHAVDLETGAIVAPALHSADQGYTATLPDTLNQALASLQEVRQDGTVQADTSNLYVKEVVADKGYHSAETLLILEDVELRGYVSEPDRGSGRRTTPSNKRIGGPYRRRYIATGVGGAGRTPNICIADGAS